MQLRGLFHRRRPALQSPRARPPRSQWITAGGYRMHVRSAGPPNAPDRPVFVLVHGLVVSSRYMVPTLVRLAREYRIHAPDFPGFGRSEKPGRVLDVPELADVLAAWMDAAGVRRAVVLGNSFGCQTAADFAVRYPERTERVVLVGPTVDAEARTAAQQLWRFMLEVPLEPLDYAPVIARDYLDAGLRRAVRTFGHMLRDRIEEKLPHIEAPTLVVRGGKDPIVPQRWADEVVRRLPHGRLVVIPGAAHALNYAAPLELARVVQPFVDPDRGIEPLPSIRRRYGT